MNIENHIAKKTLGIFSLTCCEGCQFAMMKDYDEFKKLMTYYNVINFRLGQDENSDGPFDIALVEGTPESEREISLLKEIRRESKIVIAIGSCAILGGIQSERNRLPKKYIGKNNVKSVDEIIKIDYKIPGCPISQKEIIKCLCDLHFGKIFRLPDLAVCFECRKKENICLLKNGKACLGPISRAGCDAVCINGGEMCIGCRGKTTQANFEKIREQLHPIVGEEETENLLSIFGKVEENED